MQNAPVRVFPGPALIATMLGILSLFFSSCYVVRPGSGGGKTSAKDRHAPNPKDIALPAGYKIEAVATGLSFPTDVEFDDQGGLFIVEGGFRDGKEWFQPRLMRVLSKNVFATVALGDSNGPWTGVAYAPSKQDGPGKGAFFIAEGGRLRGGRILRVSNDGKVTAIVENLPSLGDHQTNPPVIGPDGMVYFGQGTATNSGVVGPDNFKMGWLAGHRSYHDTPCRDITLSGVNYASTDPFKPGKVKDTLETGAFSPYGVKTLPGQVVKGQVPCNGAIMRISQEGGKPELVAWGLRDPFALAFSPDGRLFAIDNGYDQRGSRPIWGAPELVWEIRHGTWYGWPDFVGQKPVDRPEFSPPHEDTPQRLLERAPGSWLATQASIVVNPPDPDAPYHEDPPPAPSARLPVHSSADGLDFSRTAAFGFEGQAFIAEFGDLAPSSGKVLDPVGFKIVRVDMKTGVAYDFAINRHGPGPATKLKKGGLERPVAVRFSPDGKALYIVDFGVMTVSKEGPRARKRTGVIWRVTKEAGE
jgi:glucose/arabinose dehydrogenase